MTHVRLLRRSRRENGVARRRCRRRPEGFRMLASAAGPGANATCARRRGRTRSAADRWWLGRRRPGRNHRAHPVGRLRRMDSSSARLLPWRSSVTECGSRHQPRAADPPGRGFGCDVPYVGVRRGHDTLSWSRHGRPRSHPTVTLQASRGIRPGGMGRPVRRLGTSVASALAPLERLPTEAAT